MRTATAKNSGTWCGVQAGEREIHRDHQCISKLPSEVGPRKCAGKGCSILFAVFTHYDDGVVFSVSDRNLPHHSTIPPVYTVTLAPPRNKMLVVP